MRQVEFKTISVTEIVVNQQTLSSVIVKSLVLNVWDGTTHPTPIVVQKRTRRLVPNESAL